MKTLKVYSVHRNADTIRRNRILELMEEHKIAVDVVPMHQSTLLQVEEGVSIRAERLLRLSGL